MNDFTKGKLPADEGRASETYDADADTALRCVLHEWQTPAPSDALDARVMGAFRRTIPTQIPVSQNVLAHTDFAHSDAAQSEVAKMRKCPTCHETFADRFAFCPTDGTPLDNSHAVVAATAASTNGAGGVLDLAAVNTVAAAAHNDGDDILGVGEVTIVNASARRAATDHVAAIDGDAVAGGASTTAGGVLVGSGRGDFGLTMLQDEGLWNRLVTQTRTETAEFRRDPRGYSASLFDDLGASLKRPVVAASVATAILLLTGVVGVIIAFDRMRGDVARNNPNENLEIVGYVPDLTEIPKEQPTPEPGNAGTAKGTGGGQKPVFERPSGGGGGGRQEEAPASAGKLPTASLEPQVLAPDPKPPVIRNPSLPTVATIRADPTLFPPDVRPLPYGDPNSRSNVPSSGSGTGNGIGDGKGGGVGPGEGEGVGPGRGFNTGGGDGKVGGGGAGGGGGGTPVVDYNKNFAAREVTRKASVTSRPEPGYTEEARKNNIQGQVTLKMVLGANGQVSNISPVKRLPDGLTEKAIAAAKQIKFTPAQKDGRNVSQWITINYSFAIY